MSCKIKYSCIAIQEIFEKDKINEVNDILTSNFGDPKKVEINSPNSIMSGYSTNIKETKYVWAINSLEQFLSTIADHEKQPRGEKFDKIFKSRIGPVYIIGLTCKELPYYQIVIYVELTRESAIPILIDSSRLVVPFQAYLETLDGLSKQVYAGSRRKPRYHTHHIVESLTDLTLGTGALDNIITELKKNNESIIIDPNPHSKIIRELSIVKDVMGLPTLLSSINSGAGMFTVSSHLEQYGGGGELQTFGVTFLQTPDMFTPNFSKDKIENMIKMFSPNINIFFAVDGGINLHLFLVGLTTWLSYLDIKIREITANMEEHRETVQQLLNDGKISEVKTKRDKFSILQGSFSSIAMLLSNTNFHVMEWIDEIADNIGVFGRVEIPIPQLGTNAFIEEILLNRTGKVAHQQMIAQGVRSKFSMLAKKLETSINPINRMTDFIYNQTSYDLERAIKRNSYIEIGLAAIIGIFTFFSIKTALGL